MKSKTKKRLETIRKFILFNLLRFLGLFIIKKDNIWVFGEYTGQRFSYDPKYLYLHILKNHKNITPIWLTNDIHIYNDIRNIGGKVYLFNSIQALYYGLYAKIYIFSHSIEDIYHYAVKDATLIFLFHAMPIKDTKVFATLREKKIGYFKYKKQKLIDSFIKSNVENNYDLVIATSELTREKMFNAFNIVLKNVAITGQPRNDFFFFNNSKTAILKKLGLEKYIDKTIISYLPTFRDLRDEFKHIFSNNSDISSIDDCLILEKCHPNDTAASFKEKINIDNIINISSLEIDTQELLYITDILVTDYSSCFVDFLLLDRPMIFYIYDYEEYANYRGFLYDFLNIIPGIIAYTEKELIEGIKKYLKDPTADSNKRLKIRDAFHKYKDGNSSKRLYSEIVKLITL